MLRLEDMQPASQQPVAQTRGKQGIVQTATGQHHTTNAFGMGRLTDPLGKGLHQRGMKMGSTPSGIILIGKLREQGIEIEHRQATLGPGIDVIPPGQGQTGTKTTRKNFKQHGSLTFEAHVLADAQ